MLATGVTTLGVIAIWLFASFRQEDQTIELSRRWVGEQWDIARRCVIGTPVGRSDTQEQKADRMAAMAIEALASASEGDEEPSLETLWPARCAPLFRRLRVSPEVTGGDVSGAVGELEVLVRRVIEMDDVARTVANARELAGPIHALDRGMPAGAEYDPTHFGAPTVDPAPIEASFEAFTREPPRPFLSATAGGQPLYDELDGARLVGGDGYRRETPDGQTVLSVEGLGFPRFDGETIAWLVEGEAAIQIGERTLALPFDTPPSAFAPCDGGDAFLVLVGGEVFFVREGPASTMQASPLHPTPPLVGAAWACDTRTSVVAWPAEEADGRWVGSRCGAGGCAALPPLRAGGDLQVAVGAGRSLAVSRGRRTDLRFWRELSTSGWSAPTPVAFGSPRVVARGLQIRAGERRWTFSGAIDRGE